MSAQTPEVGATSRNSRANVTTDSQTVNVTPCETNLQHNTSVDTPAECTNDDDHDDDITFMKKVAKNTNKDTSATIKNVEYQNDVVVDDILFVKEIVMPQVAENSATIKPKKSRRKSTLRSSIPLTCERRNVHTTSSGTQTSGNLDSIDNEYASSLENEELKKQLNS